MEVIAALGALAVVGAALCLWALWDARPDTRDYGPRHAGEAR